MSKNERLTRVISGIKAKFGFEYNLDIAEAAGINYTHLSEMINGKRGITEKTSGDITSSAQKLCERFGINPDFLINGTGNVWLNDGSVNQTGDNSTHVAGNDNHINSSTLDKALDEIAAQRKLVSKAQEQIDRLLTLLEDKR